MKLVAIGKAAFLGLALATGIATGCSSKQTGSPSASTGIEDPTGSVAQELRLGRSTHINKANYTLTGPGSFSKSGSFDVSKLRELEGLIAGVPAGSPYTLSVNATSTNGNVTCSGSQSGLSVTCPGDRPQDEKTFKLTCTRNHVGREWGDDDWKENARTFLIGIEVNLACAQSDAGSDAAPDATPDTGADVGTDVCAPTACPAADNCGTLADGCGGTVTCGTMNGGCAAGLTCVSNVCKCVPNTGACGTKVCGTASDGCGGTLNCGTCATGQTCDSTGACVTCATTCPAGDDCGTVSNPAGCATTTLTCAPNNCAATGTNRTCGGGGIANHCGCTPVAAATACGSKTCGTAPDGCGSTVNCGSLNGLCATGQTCDSTGTCVTCATTCPSGDNCGTVSNPAGCAQATLTCGTCPTSPPNESCGGGSPGTANHCGCTPTTKAAACGTNVCGSAPDGCGGTISCGTCTNGTCNSSGQCVACATSCPTGDNCGTVSNPAGCATATLNCGTCSTAAPNQNTTCGGGPNPVPNVCGCTPTPAATACGSKVCGTAPDGCGGTVNCGSLAGACPNGGTCTAAGTCVACQTSCPGADNCGTITNPAGCATATLNCGTCSTAAPNQNTTCGGGPTPTPNVCGCTPSTAATACGAKVCGTAPDGCGGSVTCGSCANGGTCDGTGKCVTCATSCPAGDNCGTITNPAGCATATVNCGTCSTAAPDQNTVCGGGPTPTPNVCGCTPTTKALACGSNLCGNAPDGCGGMIVCGTCPGGACNSSGQCVPCATTCPAGDNCGTITNPAGCATATVTCGTCSTAAPDQNTICGGGPTPTPNVCGCTPTPAATACGTNACGTAPDGCGGAASCGTCATGFSCSIAAGQTAGACVPVNVNNCDGSKSTSSTLGCLQQQDKSTSSAANKCSTCVVGNSCFDPLFQGGTCESTTGNANLFSGTLPDGKTCGQVFSPLTAPVSETAVCLDVLNTIFTSKCAASLQETPCVCGTVDIASCNAGTTTPNGAGFDSFACDFNSTSTSVINAIATDFTVQTFGAGQANALIQCAAAFGCDCF